MRYINIALAGFFVLFSHAFMPGDLHAGAPTDQVRQTADQVLALMQDAKFKGPDKESQRRERLRQIIGNRFDFEEMAKRSLGSHWRKINNDEQQRFVQLFSSLLEKSYADEIESYDGEKIVYGREKAGQDQAEVDSKIIGKNGQETSLNYKLRSVGGSWKVYDVVIEDISLVNNYRSQFSRILGRSTFSDLIKKLEQKSPEIKDVRS